MLPLESSFKQELYSVPLIVALPLSVWIEPAVVNEISPDVTASPLANVKTAEALIDSSAVIQSSSLEEFVTKALSDADNES